MNCGVNKGFRNAETNIEQDLNIDFRIIMVLFRNSEIDILTRINVKWKIF